MLIFNGGFLYIYVSLPGGGGGGTGVVPNAIGAIGATDISIIIYI